MMFRILDWLCGVFEAVLGHAPRLPAPLPECRVSTCDHETIEVTLKRISPATGSNEFPLAATIYLELQCAGCCRTWNTHVGLMGQVDLIGNDAVADKAGEMCTA